MVNERILQTSGAVKKCVLEKQQQTNFMKNMRKKYRKRGNLNSNSGKKSIKCYNSWPFYFHIIARISAYLHLSQSKWLLNYAKC